MKRKESPKTNPAKPLAIKKYNCVLLISKESPAMVMIKNKITDASIILVTFNCRDPILRDASVNAIDVPDQRKAVRSAISSPNNILSKK